MNIGRTAALGQVAEAAAADVVVVAVPLAGFADVPAEPLAGKIVVADFYDRAGFDTVDIGRLDQGWKIGMGQPAFVTRQNAQQLRENVARARR